MEQKIDQQLPSIPHHTVERFSQTKQPEITFNSCFDSGNMSKVNRNSYDHYSIWTAADAQGTPNQGYPKSWFYFQVGGFINRKITFSIHRVHFLWSVSKRANLYRPVFKIVYQNQQSSWQRLPHPIISLNLNESEQLVLKFDFFFTSEMKTVKFAFIYPFSYQEQRKQVLRLKSLFEQNQDSQIFFKQYNLIKSYQKRTLDLIIISSHQGKDGYQNIKYDEYFDLGEKLIKFRNNKPIIFISARVHPIQTPSSFCMKGAIDFLLDKKDSRAFLLRKYFVFVLIPMLNPDGVSNGHCRMDQLNQNLNRYYKNPDPVKQSPCYAVRKLCEHYQKDSRMFMYLDLHAHPAIKGNFMFGNAIYDFIEQVQSQVFPKILSQNCINFQFQNCIFSRRHMKAKDRFQDMNKQGCGRVVLYKDFGIPHAYTLQCGYHLNAYNNKIQPEKNTNQKYIVRYRLGKNNQKIYENVQRLYSPQMLIKIQQSLYKNQETSRKINVNKNYSEKLVTSQQERDIRVSNKSEENEQKELKSKDTVLQKIDVKRLTRNSHLNRTRFESQKISENLKVKSSNFIYDGYDIFEFTSSPYDDINSSYYKKQVPLYNIESYENLGRNILITILDIFNKNPYSRGIDLSQKRKQIAEKQSKLDRFRKEQAGIRNKMKNIVQLIEGQFYSSWIKRNVFTHSDTTFPDRTKKVKTTQFQILRSSQNKARLSAKQTGNIELKKNLVLQSDVLKTSIANELSTQINSMIKITQEKSNEEYQNKIRNNLLAKKIKSFKSKSKAPLKQFWTKQGIGREEMVKRSIPLPTSQNIITLQQQIRVVKNEGICLSSKIIKHPSYNMANLRVRNFMMQGNNAFSSNYHSHFPDPRSHHAYSMGNK